MNKREQLLGLVTIILIGFLFAKSLFLDEIKPTTPDEVKFKSFVEKRLLDGKEELGILNKTGMTSFKVVKIEQLSDKGTSKILYFDEASQSYVEGEIKGKYKARVRGYMLYVLPYKEFTIEVGSNGN